MQKHISAAEMTPVRVVVVTLDNHLAGAIARAEQVLQKEIPGLRLTMHAAGDWQCDPSALTRCLDDIAQGDIIIVNMLFLDEHIRAVLPALQARREECDAMVCCIAAGEVVKLTRLGRFRMDEEKNGGLSLLKKLRGNRGKAGPGGENEKSAASQMRTLRRLPRILKFIPGTAQDLRAYFLTMQYWLSGSEENTLNLVRFLVDRYADGPRRALRGALRPAPPLEYPEVGLYYPGFDPPLRRTPVATTAQDVAPRGTVGLLLMRSYLLAGNSSHYDAVIEALRSRGLNVISAFASGLDARPAIEEYFLDKDSTRVDAVVSLTGFSLVGGPAYNDARAAEAVLARLDVPYVSALPVEFQTLEQWQNSEQGLLPIESTVMVAIPELDGATGSMVFAGRTLSSPEGSDRDMQADPERVARLADRVAKLVTLRRAAKADRRIAIVLFNFPPNGGSTGTAAFLSVFESLWRTLEALKSDGYRVDLPASVDALRQRVLEGNASRYGTAANVHARIPADEHVRREPWLAEIEAQWGPAPGKHNSDGSAIQILGERFGNVFVGIQPAFGFEGDPMRLLFEKGFAPTHAFSAFYRWMREDFDAHAVLHFGTHGALEFMPGKQAGLSAKCWPERLIGDLPNIYLYAANNPSEGTLAKRRSAATLVSYLTPPVTTAGLYRGLLELNASLQEWRQLTNEARAARLDLLALIQAQAAAVELAEAAPAWSPDDDSPIRKLTTAVLELEYTLIPHGLHVVGEPATEAERIDLLAAMADSSDGPSPTRPEIEAIVAATHRGEPASAKYPPDSVLARLSEANDLLARDTELHGLLHALDGRFVRPAPGGDLIRTPAILPTGRNIHGFDPFRIPSKIAILEGRQQAQCLLARHAADGNPAPEAVALVLWGTDNLKSGGGPIAQALALIGAEPRFDSYGRLAGATLIPLEQLGRPRIDVVVTLSGIFRDLLPLQIKLLAEAAYLAASADEPETLNFVRKHVLRYQAEHHCDLETASLRVFGNAEGAYGSNINHLVENGRWECADEIAEMYERRKGFAYGRQGRPSAQPKLLADVLAGVDLTYQNLESVELGVTTIDTYFDTLGGITGAVRRARGAAPPVYIGDQTRGENRVRTLGEQIALETRTRVVNPKWYEGMIRHGYEGVRQIEAHVTNTVGWSATTGHVTPWVYQSISQTFVLDKEMRDRLAALNPTSSVKLAQRLIEAHQRQFWSPDDATLAALRDAADELEDRLEGLTAQEAAA